jgi:hypothetical protein
MLAAGRHEVKNLPGQIHFLQSGGKIQHVVANAVTHSPNHPRVDHHPLFSHGQIRPSRPEVGKHQIGGFS